MVAEMEKKNIIIIVAAAIVVILAAAWFLFNPFSSDNGKTAESISITENQTTDPIAEPNESNKGKQESKKIVNQTNESGIYIVKEGDTLQSIAKDIYGETKYWIKIFAVNETNIDWYDDLRLDQKLVLPDIK